MADCTRYSCHSFVATNCHWLISEKDQCQRARSPVSQHSSHVDKSAFPDHCDEGIFQDCLSLGLSLWDLHLRRLFHSAVLHTVCYPCWDCIPFLWGPWMRQVWALAEKCPSLWVSELQSEQEHSAHWQEPSCYIWLVPNGPKVWTVSWWNGDLAT